MSQQSQGGSPINLTASGIVSKLPGNLLGFYVNSTTSGTIVIYDNATGATTGAVSGTITPSVGWNYFPAQFTTGCSVTLANTINVTFMFNPG